ncbi:transglycosylase domain-containing protein [Alicyclobacillus sp. SP_1]|uniref:transglycosylase domain-containing protein n=1 Tax=Alicyclobacillus sp. SP_1 TaxID=2942475 RepID=UPI00215750D3|nr:transglycosylase domain-containing protein [Alicyclobacillus sp. SP_1]
MTERDKALTAQTHHHPKHRRRRTPRIRRMLSRLLLSMLVVCTMFGGASFGAYAYASLRELPKLTPDALSAENVGSIALDRHGQRLGELTRGEECEPIHSLGEVSPALIHAFVAAEDRTFFSNSGIRPVSMLRAAVEDVLDQRIVSGASTITQQTVKLAMFPKQERTFKRKFQEALLAVEANRLLTKDEILVDYLNRVYFGHIRGIHVYGVKTAARRLFGRDLKNLTLAQAALIAALPNNPELNSPYMRPTTALERAHYILQEMESEGYATQEDVHRAQSENVLGELVRQPIRPYGKHPYLMADEIQPLVVRLLTQNGVYPNEAEAAKAIPRAGLTVETTIDADWQNHMERVLQSRTIFGTASARPFAQGHHRGTDLLEGGAALIDNHTGDVLALGGGRDYEADQYDHADLARQPGSAIKPLLDYGPALDLGVLTPATLLDDAPTVFPGQPPFAPKNDDGRFHGRVSVRRALVHSLNIPAVKVLSNLGPATGFRYLAALGMGVGAKTTVGQTTVVADDVTLASAIGGLTHGVTVLQMTSAYTCLGNGGVWHPARLITRISDRYGHVLYSAVPKAHRVFRRDTAFLLTNMLEDVVRHGTGRMVSKTFPNIPIAGKTGTTDHEENGWFVGYTPDYSLGVWTGYNHNQPIPRAYYNVKMRFWEALMRPVLTASAPVRDFQVPDNVVQLDICERTGELATAACRRLGNSRKEWFCVNHIPTTFCNVCSHPSAADNGGDSWNASPESAPNNAPPAEFWPTLPQ